MHKLTYNLSSKQFLGKAGANPTSQEAGMGGWGSVQVLMVASPDSQAPEYGVITAI